MREQERERLTNEDEEEQGPNQDARERIYQELRLDKSLHEDAPGKDWP